MERGVRATLAQVLNATTVRKTRPRRYQKEPTLRITAPHAPVALTSPTKEITGMAISEPLTTWPARPYRPRLASSAAPEPKTRLAASANGVGRALLAVSQVATDQGVATITT